MSKLSSYATKTFAEASASGNFFVPVFSETEKNKKIDIHQFGSTQAIENAKGAIKNGGALTDAASVTVPNNSLSTLTSSQAALTLNVACGANEVPNFAVEITAGAAITLTVTKTVGSTTTTLKYAESAGNTLEIGKFYQVTCVGNCWTLAEFVSPS